jgi:hypothetical protein
VIRHDPHPLSELQHGKADPPEQPLQALELRDNP